MLATFTVTNSFDTTTSDVGSLRWAIDQANSNTNPAIVDVIRFAGNALNTTINLQSALPTITEPLDIRVNFPTGSDQVTLNGTNAPGSGLVFNVPIGPSLSHFMVVEGLVIKNFSGDGISVVDLPNNAIFSVQSNEIDNNAGNGIDIDLPAFQDIERWTISGNTITNNTVGIRVADVDKTEFSINGNRIGTDGTSTDDGNSSHGIHLSNSGSLSSTNSFISANTISGNGGHGIFLDDTFFTGGEISSNEIGVDENSTFVIPNQMDGIQLFKSRTEIRTNVIGGNVGDGITLNDSDDVELRFNGIGTKFGTTTDFGNQGSGVLITGGSRRTIISSNDINFNDSDGIALFSGARESVISFNEFTSNSGDGVSLFSSTTDRNEITENDFVSNGGSPIDLLGIDGINPNDGDDSDPGPNDLMNYPVIQTGTVALSNGTWTIPFLFDVDVAADYRFEFYRYDSANDDYSFIKSEAIPGVTVGMSDFLGDVTFDDGNELNSGDRLSVLAVRTTSSSSGNTSELSFPTSPIANSDTTPPKITDVILDGSAWTGKTPVSFASRVVAGEQLRPIATQGVNTLTIEFDEGVMMSTDGSDLVLKGEGDLAVQFTGFSHVQGSSTATWTFGAGLVDAKYAIHLDDSVVDLGGNRLNAEWVNADNGTLDLYSDDPTQSFAADLGDNTAGTEGGEFRFHFALLVGDYSGNGKVGGEDLIQWQQQNGTTGDPNNVADGDGDGNVDAADFGLQDGAFGDELALWLGSLDQIDDDIFDGKDLSLWSPAFGSNIGDANYESWADANSDGAVDGFDFLLLQLRAGETTAWYVPTTGSGLAAALVGPAAPQVTNVIISGSASLHAPFSFDTVDGGGSQLATVPVGGADTISIVFSEGVNISAGSLLVIGMTTANMPTLADFSYDTATNTATWRFEGWALGDNYLISLSDSVTDVDGNLLDGEWTNPESISTTNSLVSEFPSGDGNPGGRFNFFMTLLAGDANLNGVVDITDFGILATNWGVTTGALFANGDFNGDGTVSLNDFSSLVNNWGTNLQNVWVLADLDGDYDVDAADLNTITSNFGMTGATWADGDLNGDGNVTIEDLDLAFLQFGLGLDLVA